MKDLIVFFYLFYSVGVFGKINEWELKNNNTASIEFSIGSNSQYVHLSFICVQKKLSTVLMFGGNYSPLSDISYYFEFNENDRLNVNVLLQLNMISFNKIDYYYFLKKLISAKYLRIKNKSSMKKEFLEIPLEGAFEAVSQLCSNEKTKK